MEAPKHHPLSLPFTSGSSTLSQAPSPTALPRTPRAWTGLGDTGQHGGPWGWPLGREAHRAGENAVSLAAWKQLFWQSTSPSPAPPAVRAQSNNYVGATGGERVRRSRALPARCKGWGPCRVPVMVGSTSCWGGGNTRSPSLWLPCGLGVSRGWNFPSPHPPPSSAALSPRSQWPGVPAH